MRTGDKIRIKAGPHKGKRGLIEDAVENTLTVRLDNQNTIVTLMEHDVTNYSLAARKAWERMPHRRVGRPAGATSSDRISVTLRIDRNLWASFTEAESKGLIANRTHVVNMWFAEKLAEINKQECE
uniref:KOW domain-containing protein n=2 Tax=Rubinisphaera brasiliensis TaxID=119 RepID=F0SQJ4_RUBBR|nr:hypothetical protein Plabr_0340 [Rubinisphaera brasiliensis DSM 5305]